MADFEYFRRIAAACLFPALRQSNYLSDPAYRKQILQLADAGVGGFCIFQGGIEETSSIIAELQARAGGSLLFCADFEYGLPMRLNGGTAFPQAMAYGRANDTKLTRESARIIAREMKAIGIDWNFAPVCDINSNSLNPIINIRSFGETPDLAARHSSAFALGLQDEGVIACAKHFPGHGDVDIDSHLEMPVLRRSRKELEEMEFIPFRAAIAAGVRSVMTAHIATPALGAENTPASLSKSITTGVLRQELGFKGIIVTDALEMQAITRLYSAGDAAVAAINAGANAVLIPDNPFEALDSLADKAAKNPEFVAILLNSSEIISQSKEWSRQFHKPKLPLPTAQHAEIALDAAKAAINISDPKSVLPLDKYSSYAALAYCSDDNIDSATEFFRYLAQTVERDCDFGYIDEAISDDRAKTLAEDLDHAEVIVVAFFIKARAYRGSVAIGENVTPKLRTIINGKPFIAIFFGTPYLTDIVNADCSARCYSDVSASVGAAALALSGRLS